MDLGISGSDLLKIALSSGVVAGLVNSGVQWFKEDRLAKKKAKDEATYDAIQIVARFDVLAVNCANAIWEHKNAIAEWAGTGNEHRIQPIEWPKLDLDGLSIMKIEKKTASEIHWLENEVAKGRNLIMARWMLYLDSDDAAQQSSALVGYFGHRCLQISDHLRSLYELKMIGPEWGMSEVRKLLLEQHVEARKLLKTGD